MTSSFGNILVTIVALFVLIVFVGSIYTFMHGVVQFIFSAGNEEKIKRVFYKIRYAIIGILLTLLFLFVLPVLFKKMGLPNYDDYTARSVFERVTSIVQGVLNFGSEVDRVNRYQ